MRLKKWQVWYKSFWVAHVLEYPYEIVLYSYFTEDKAIKKSRVLNDKLSEAHPGYYFVRKHAKS